MIAVESVSLFIVVFFVSGPFNLELLVHRNCCVCHVKVFIKSATDHHEKPYIFYIYFCCENLMKLLKILHNLVLKFRKRSKTTIFLFNYAVHTY